MKVKLSGIEKIARDYVQHYNPKKYWKYRQSVVSCIRYDPISLYKLYYIKKCDAFNKASLGTHMGYGAKFAGMPNFPHGLYGIIVSHNSVIGTNCTILHNVTIGEGKNGAPTIGNNVLIGTGAIIIGNIHVGNNVKIGAGTVVTEDVPDNATVVCSQVRVILNEDC